MEIPSVFLSLLVLAARDPGEDLRSPDFKVRQAAARKLEASGEKAVPILLREFARVENSVVARLRAARILLFLGDRSRSAVPELRKRLTDPETCIRRRAAHVLMEIDPEGVQVMLPLLGHADAGVRDDAGLALQRLGAKAVSPLIAAMKGDEEKLRAPAIDALGRLAPLSREALPDLVATLRGKDVELKLRAARALAEFGRKGSSAEPALVEALTHAEARVRRAGAEALRRIVPSRVETRVALAAALKDPDVEVRRAAAGTLVRVGAGADLVLENLKEARGDADPIVRSLAAKAVERLDPEAVEPAVGEGLPVSPLASTVPFPMRTMDHLRAHVFVNGERRGRTVYPWSLSTATGFDPRIPVPAWPPPGSLRCGAAEGEHPVVLEIAGTPEAKMGPAAVRMKYPHLLEGEQVLFVAGMVGGKVRRGALRLRLVGEDGGLYRFVVYDPAMSMETREHAHFLHSLWFERVDER